MSAHNTSYISITQRITLCTVLWINAVACLESPVGCEQVTKGISIELGDSNQVEGGRLVIQNRWSNAINIFLDKQQIEEDISIENQIAVGSEKHFILPIDFNKITSEVEPYPIAIVSSQLNLLNEDLHGIIYNLPSASKSNLVH